MAQPRNIAVLLAGGVGSRVGLDIPKQLIKIAGKPIIEHTLGVLHAHEQVDEIVILMAPGHLDAVRAIVRDGGYDKVTAILEGADTRSHTTMRALDHIAEKHGGGEGGEDPNVLLHDAVRPLLDPRIVSDCFAALATATPDGNRRRSNSIICLRSGMMNELQRRLDDQDPDTWFAWETAKLDVDLPEEENKE